MACRVVILISCILAYGTVFTFIMYYLAFTWKYEVNKKKPTANFDKAMMKWRWIPTAFSTATLVVPFCLYLNTASKWPLLGCLLFPLSWPLRSLGDSLIKQWFLKHDTKLLELACSKLKEPNKHSWHSFEEADVIKALYSLGLGDEIDERRYKAALSFHRFDESAIKKRMTAWCRTGAWTLNE